MKAAWYSRNGPAREVLAVGDLPRPAPQAGEVLVELHTSGVNPSDVKSRAGRPVEGGVIVPHSDGAGVIAEVGPGVSRQRIGERVWIWNGQWRRPMGTAAESIVLPQGQAVPLPANVSFEAGACIGIPVLTALQAVRLAGDLDGRTLLVTGGGSAVGHYVAQLARRRGATVLATVGSDARRVHALNAGAHHVIDYKREDVAARVKALTAGVGADAVIDMDFSTTAKLLAQGALRPHGRLVGYGSNQPGDVPVNFRTLLWSSLELRFFVVYDLLPADREAVTREAVELLERDALAHTIGAVFPLEEVAAAHEKVEAGDLVGNVVLKIRG
jgi:NADPH2:quinone reductase